MSGSVNGEQFFDYVRGSLIPEMLPLDGENPNAVAVLDNCSIHVREVIKDACPFSSPDFNPIERMFSFVKYCLKDHDDLWQSMNYPTVLVQAALYLTLQWMDFKLWLSLDTVRNIYNNTSD